MFHVLSAVIHFSLVPCVIDHTFVSKDVHLVSNVNARWRKPTANSRRKAEAYAFYSAICLFVCFLLGNGKWGKSANFFFSSIPQPTKVPSGTIMPLEWCGLEII